MELASVDEENGKLVIKASQHLLLIRLVAILALSTPWLLLIVSFVFGNKFRSPADIFRDPISFLLLFPTIALPLGLIQAITVLRAGQTFTFDRQADLVCSNSKRIAALSDLQAVKIHYSPYRWLVQRRGPIKGLARLLLTPWPGVWIVLNSQEALRILDTTLLIKLPIGPPDVMLQRQMREEAVAVAARVAEFADVAFQDK